MAGACAHRFEVGGTLLSALVLESVSGRGGVWEPLSGLLLGVSRVHSVERVTDEDELRSSSERVTTALSFSASTEAPFFDASGAVDAADVEGMAAAVGATAADVVGFWVSRRDVPPTPSLRDAAVHASLLDPAEYPPAL